ncbi:MAG: hypothetical protein ACTH1W_03200 [Advenella sp.]|nr:hypothetical protein [Advenella sp. S44]
MIRINNKGTRHARYRVLELGGLLCTLAFFIAPICIVLSGAIEVGKRLRT